MRFLVIDDDFETRLLVQKMLCPFGIIDVATDGEEGIMAFTTALKEGKPYSLITLDILMPNMDGQQTLRELREIEKERGVTIDKQTKVLMITGLDDSEEVHNAFSFGETTRFIVKPIDRSVLLAEIVKMGIPLPEA